MCKHLKKKIIIILILIKKKNNYKIPFIKNGKFYSKQKQNKLTFKCERKQNITIWYNIQSIVENTRGTISQSCSKVYIRTIRLVAATVGDPVNAVDGLSVVTDSSVSLSS